MAAAFLDTVEDDPMRFTSMSIASKGDCTVREQRVARGTRSVNQTDDIPGATVRPLHGRYTRNRPDLHETTGIDGATSRTLHPNLRKDSTVNRVDDIDGARPRPNGFVTTRAVDPLMPHYRLPRSRPAPPVEVPLRRDPLMVDDIDGARATQRFGDGKPPRSTLLDTGDIDGARARHVPESAKPPPRDLLATRDITEGGRFRTMRETNPLQPRHVIHGTVVEDEPGMRPRPGRPPRSAPDFNLTTNDVPGAQAGSRSTAVVGGIAEDRRRTFRSTNATDDIPGAQAGTRRRGLRSRRETNPNDRIYPLLDGRRREKPTPTEELRMRRLRTPQEEELDQLRTRLAAAEAEAAAAATLQAEVATLRESLALASTAATTAAPHTSNGGDAGGGGGGGDAAGGPQKPEQHPPNHHHNHHRDIAPVMSGRGGAATASTDRGTSAPASSRRAGQTTGRLGASSGMTLGGSGEVGLPRAQRPRREQPGSSRGSAGLSGATTRQSSARTGAPGGADDAAGPAVPALTLTTATTGQRHGGSGRRSQRLMASGRAQFSGRQPVSSARAAAHADSARRLKAELDAACNAVAALPDTVVSARAGP